MKKGQVSVDAGWFLLVIAIVVIGVIAILGYYVSDVLKTEIEGEFKWSYANETIEQTKTTYATYDIGLLVLVIFFGIVAIISGFMIRTHPIFFIVSLLILIVLTLFTPQVGNIFGEIAESGELASTTQAHFSITSWLFNNLPITMLILSVIAGVIGFAKPQGGGVF